MDPYRFQTDVAPKIENIEMLELLGKGGMSIVYKAKQLDFERTVAVKVLSKITDEYGIKRFKQEAKNTSGLNHPNIVKIMSFGVSQNKLPYLVMEYLEGLSLSEELKKHGRLSLLRFRDTFLPLLSALGLAHEAGLVHRDIKPGNIMISKASDDKDLAKLVDFGIAKAYVCAEEDQNLTKTGAVVGSPAYMSPEQCLGNPLDGRSDLYSLACVMYECLSGELPYAGESSLEIMQKHVSAAPPTVSDLSRKIDIGKELASTVLWGLNKDPLKRPQTAAEFAKRLNEVLEKITLEKVPRIKIQAKLSLRSGNLSAYFRWTLLALTAMALAKLFLIQAIPKAEPISVLKQEKNNGLTRPKDNRMRLNDLARDFDPKSLMFVGENPKRDLIELKSLAKTKLRPYFAYIVWTFMYGVQNRLKSPLSERLISLQQALKNSTDAEGNETKESAMIHFEMGKISHRQENLQSALAQTKLCLKLLESPKTKSLNIPNSFKMLRNTISKTDCYVEMGCLLELAGQYRDALAFYGLGAEEQDVQPRWRLDSFERKLILLKKMGQTKKADQCLEALIDAVRPYVQNSSKIQSGEYLSETQNAFDALMIAGNHFKTLGFIEYARKVFLNVRDFAKELGWKQKVLDAQQSLKGLGAP